jgi:hypothetical protein
MYHFSRSIYRELAPRVVEEADDAGKGRHKQEVLDACESAIQRLTYDGRYVYAWRVIEVNIGLAEKFLANCPGGVDLDGRPRHCQAHTREGTPCQRVPLPGRDFCPSHKHFEEFLAGSELTAAA